MRVKELFAFIRERHRIYIRKYAGEPKPWTKDPILQQYRFCNVFRELDTVTEWITNNWRAPHTNDKDLWFAMCVARLVNWPDTLNEIGYPVPWNATKFVKAMHKRKAAGKKVFSGAYIVSTNGHTMDKAQYLAERVLTPLWESRKDIRPVEGNDLELLHKILMNFDGMGSFMAAQVVADVKYAIPMLTAPDWWVFAASGPGSRRGLNRVLGRPVDSPWKEGDWYKNLIVLLAKIKPMMEEECEPPMHAQDLQNCLCEFDKYERTRLGEGTPRSKYPGLN